jgi:hypothetical protein
MRGAYNQYLKQNGKTDAVENAAALHKEACELRLARIANGAEPSHKNGTPYPEPKEKIVTTGTGE